MGVVLVVGVVLGVGVVGVVRVVGVWNLELLRQTIISPFNARPYCPFKLWGYEDFEIIVESSVRVNIYGSCL